MTNDDEADNAIENLDDRDLDGSHIVVKKARPREETGGRGGGGGQFRPTR
jgi:RNA recognition motif-containing protein